MLIYFTWDFTETRLPGFAPFLAAIDKASLHPLRLATMLALTYLIAHLVARDAAWLRSPPALLLALLGQQALPVFCAGIALSFLGRVALEETEGWWMQAAVNLLGFGALVLLAVLTAWYGGEKRATRQAAGKSLSGAAAPDRG